MEFTKTVGYAGATYTLQVTEWTNDKVRVSAATEGYTYLKEFKHNVLVDALKVAHSEMRGHIDMLNERRKLFLEAVKASGEFDTEPTTPLHPTRRIHHFCVTAAYDSPVPLNVDELAELLEGCIEEMRIADHEPLTDGSGDFECDWVSVKPMSTHECRECGAHIPDWEVSGIGAMHSEACSLHPSNVVGG